MFVNKINPNYQTKPSFKGYSHEINDYGTKVLRFNYPFDNTKSRCFVEFFKVEKDPTVYAGYKISNENIAGKIEIFEGGTEIDISQLLKQKPEEAFAYRIVVTDLQENNRSERLEAGTHIHDGKYILVTQNGTTPMHEGKKGVILMADSFLPGAYYMGYDTATPGKIVYDEERQKNAEKTIRTYNNHFGGSLAGVHYTLNEQKDLGITDFYFTPFASGDNVSSHGYWNGNNNQLSRQMGNLEQFDALSIDMFKNGQRIVYDATFTSEGLEGVHVQHALTSDETDPLAKALFTMEDKLTLGIVPQNQEFLSHEVFNPPVLYTQDDHGNIKIIKNAYYDSNKETYIKLKHLTNTEDKLSNNSYQDGVIEYRIYFEKADDYTNRLEALKEFNKHSDTKIKVTSAEGTIFLSKTSAIDIGKDAKGATFWDDNVDLMKRNHSVSGYDETINQAESSAEKRDYLRNLRKIGSYINTDMDAQTIARWGGRIKNNQIKYIAKTLNGAKSSEEIDNLISKGLLPQEATLSNEAVQNIINDWYFIEDDNLFNKDDITLNSLMSLPLNAIEFGPKTVGILSTPYFSNRATSPDTIGKTRFELMKSGNPHLIEPYKSTYYKVEQLYQNEIKNFADQIIEELNKKSTEKLLDENGNYTEYGKSVIQIFGQDIVRHAIFKAIVRDNFEYKTVDGIIHYDYDKIFENTDLKALGINDATVLDKAEHLYRIIKNGLQTLNHQDIETLSDAFYKQIEGTTTNDFKLAQAIYNKASLGMNGRLDALKDSVDMDAVRNKMNSFGEAWDDLIKYSTVLTEAFKKVNPNAVITAEITDIDQMLRQTFGEKFNEHQDSYNELLKLNSKYKSSGDAIIQLIQNSGITTEAGYSYFFSSVIKAISRNFESAEKSNIHGIMESYRQLVTTRNLDFIKNLFTFVGNHDKARVAHFFALNLDLYYGNFSPFKNNSLNYEENKWIREEALKRLSGVDNLKDMPLEYRLNVNNPDYFMAISPKAIAMSTLLNDAINQNVPKIEINDKEKEYLKKALADLSDGKYLNYGKQTNRLIIQNEDLSSIDGALNKIFVLAQNHGLSLSEKDINNLKSYMAELASSDKLVYKHLVQGDFDWSGDIGRINNEKAADILMVTNNTTDNKQFNAYSIYVICLASLLKEALRLSNTDPNSYNAISNAIKDFAEEYKKEKFNSELLNQTLLDTPHNAMRKNGFATKEIDTCVDMLLEHAQYLAKKDGQEDLFKNADQTSAEIYANAVEPGIQKLGICLSVLSALPGIASFMAGDEIGSTGAEEKAKNIDLGNRNVGKYTELTNGPKKAIRERIKNYIDYSMELRDSVGVDALSTGTPYEIKTSNNDVPGILYQDAKGNMAISLINLTGYNHDSRKDYFKDYNLYNPEARAKAFDQTTSNFVSVNPNNPMVPIQGDCKLNYIELPWGIALPLGTVFYNVAKGCEKDEFIVSYIEDKGRKFLGLIRNEKQNFGREIVINGKTGRNGIMVLKRAAKVAFKGNNINKQYNVTSPIYQNYNINNIQTVGQNLSILAN